MKIKRIIALGLIGAFSLTLLGGCGTASSEEEYESVASSEESNVITDPEMLESGQAYVYRDGCYYPLYVAEASFDTTDNTTTDDTRTLWFSEEEWNKIPTLYEGDSLVYRYDEDLDETSYIERFEYVGWTFGVANLTQTATGRYSYSGDDTDNVDSTSTAYNLLSLGEYVLILDKVGGVSLRSGNITRGGLILGLEKDMAYEVEAYVGTNLNMLTLVADRIALTSMEYTTTTDYDFLQSTIIEIYLPEELNTGYYAVNGSGIFRYVKGDSWDENTDFNIDNVYEDEEEAEDETEETEDEATSSEDDG